MSSYIDFSTSKNRFIQYEVTLILQTAQSVFLGLSQANKHPQRSRYFQLLIAAINAEKHITTQNRLSERFRTACLYNYSDQNYASGVSSTAGASGATSAALAFFSFFAAFSAAKSILSFKSDKD